MEAGRMKISSVSTVCNSVICKGVIVLKGYCPRVIVWGLLFLKLVSILEKQSIVMCTVRGYIFRLIYLDALLRTKSQDWV